MNNTIEQLLEFLSHYGTVRICKKGFVFTLIMTGPGLSKWTVVESTMNRVLEFCGDQYSGVEAMVVEDELYCLILKPIATT